MGWGVTPGVSAPAHRAGQSPDRPSPGPLWGLCLQQVTLRKETCLPPGQRTASLTTCRGRRALRVPQLRCRPTARPASTRAVPLGPQGIRLGADAPAARCAVSRDAPCLRPALVSSARARETAARDPTRRQHSVSSLSDEARCPLLPEPSSSRPVLCTLTWTLLK